MCRSARGGGGGSQCIRYRLTQALLVTGQLDISFKNVDNIVYQCTCA